MTIGAACERYVDVRCAPNCTYPRPQFTLTDKMLRCKRHRG